MTAVAGAVATVPEGLPVVLTIALLVSAEKMAKTNASFEASTVETTGQEPVLSTLWTHGP